MNTAEIHKSTPDRVRNALRGDAVKAAEAYAALPANERTAEALQQARERAQPWFDFLSVAELLRPPELCEWDARPANDNDNAGFRLDCRHDLRPSVEELIQAHADGLRPFVRTPRHHPGKAERFAGGIHYHSEDDAITIGGRSSAGRFYGLHFHRGALVWFGQNGRRKMAIEDRSEPRGPDVDYDLFSSIETTVMAGAPPALGELERARRATEVLAAAGPEKARLVVTILQADDFAEIAEAANVNPSSHNGRRVTIRTLREINQLIAA